MAHPGQRRTNQTRRITPPRTGLPLAPFAGDFDRVDLTGDEFAGDRDDLAGDLPDLAGDLPDLAGDLTGPAGDLTGAGA